MDLNQLNLFTKIAVHGSLTKASIALDVEQSVISRQLNALETELGGRLFHRTGRGMALTEFGGSVLPRVKTLLLQFDQVAEEIRSEAGVLSGDVRLGVLPAFSYPILPSLYRHLKEKFPLIHLHLFEGSNGQLTEWIGAGSIDIALLYRYDNVDEAETKILGSSDAYLISRADDPMTEKPEISFENLKGLPFVLPSIPNSLRVSISDIARSKNFSLDVVLEADSLPIQKNMVLDREAYAILGRHAILREQEAGLLRASRIVDPAIVRTAVIVISAGRPSTLAVRHVAKALEPLVIKILGTGD